MNTNNILMNNLLPWKIPKNFIFKKILNNDLRMMFFHEKTKKILF